METTKVIDTITRDHLKPVLIAAGFRKKANNFWRETVDTFDVINVQKSQWNSLGEATFTINLGVFWKRIQELLGDVPATFPPKEYQCTVRQRLGFLFNRCPEFPNGRDYWWTVDAKTDARATGNEVALKIQAFALPWFERLHGLEELLNEIQSEDCLAPASRIMRFRKEGLI